MTLLPDAFNLAALDLVAETTGLSDRRFVDLDVHFYPPFVVCMQIHDPLADMNMHDSRAAQAEKRFVQIFVHIFQQVDVRA